MFDGDPQARVKDRDRDRAVYVIEAALRNGQISQADRDLRIQQAGSASTVGELDGLVRDIAALPAPAPTTATVAAGSAVPSPVPAAPAPPGPPTPYVDPYAPGASRPDGRLDPVPADLYGPPHVHSAKVARLATTATSRRKFRWVGIVALIFFAAPGLFGGLIAAFQSGNAPSFSDPGSGNQPVPSGPAFQLNGGGIRDYVSAFRDSFQATQVVRAVFYDGYVVAWVPEDNDQVSLWNYRDGAFDQLGDPMDRTSADTEPVDLADLRPAKVMKLVRIAQRELDVPAPSTTYVIFDRSFIDSSPEIAVYISDGNGADGFLDGDLDGKVISKSVND